ncbi:MAG: hypothetical protein H7X88_05660 [Gloeobacteraceae cyanobacterium ES-bin-316]|nr:hypothetical protein [Ferruginibacter sp.]
METIIVKPKNKEELELVSVLLKRMNIRAHVQKKTIIQKKKIKEQFLESLEGRLKEVQLHMAGKIKLKSWDEVYKDL